MQGPNKSSWHLNYYEQRRFLPLHNKRYSQSHNYISICSLQVYDIHLYIMGQLYARWHPLDTSNVCLGIIGQARRWMTLKDFSRWKSKNRKSMIIAITGSFFPISTTLFTNRRKLLFMICCANLYRFYINTIYRPRSKMSDLDIICQGHRGWQMRTCHRNILVPTIFHIHTVRKLGFQFSQHVPTGF